MLIDFFHLNPEVTEIESEEELLDHFKRSDQLKNVIYRPDKLAPTRPLNRFSNYKFENVSFSKTVIKEVIFIACEFKDCLFIGTTFLKCEFHRCKFNGCNLHKIIFKDTYINPNVFAKLLDHRKHSNIGVHLFHQLNVNSLNTYQRDFAITAEFFFRKWKRYQLTYEWKNGELGFLSFFKQWLPNILYYLLAGYGLRAKFFAKWTIILVSIVVFINYYFWNVFTIIGKEGKNGLIEAFYFTIITLTTVGYGDLVPASNIGMFVIGLEAILGIVWLGVFASMIIRRLVR